MSPQAKYQNDVENGLIQFDIAQQEVVNQLERIYVEMQSMEANTLWQSLKNRLVNKPKTVKGLYVWGGVGRGKTYLMDCFFNALPFDQKLRVHFHRFMQMVHKRLTELENSKNPLVQIATEFSEKYRIVCFDEFFVSDIGDAMILGALTTEMFDRGMVLVATSNIEPNGLYKDGLQRTRFLPAIEQINQNMEVLELVSDTDYRLRMLDQAKLYWTPINEDSKSGLLQAFDTLTAGHIEKHEDIKLDVLGRKIPCRFLSEDVAWFHFDSLCDGPRSQNDYIELAKLFHTMVIEGVPVFTESKEEQARRFINLIDEFYDRGVKLFISADASITELYKGQRVTFEFERTESRLIEMQSHDYLAQPHKP